MATYPNYNTLSAVQLAQSGARRVSNAQQINAARQNPGAYQTLQPMNPNIGSQTQSMNMGPPPQPGMPPSNPGGNWLSNFYNQTWANDPGMENARKAEERYRTDIMMNPNAFYGQTLNNYQQYMNDPSLGGGYKNQMDQGYNQLGQSIRGYEQGLGGLQRLAQGRDSVVAKQAQAQRQLAMQDVAQQAALQGAAGNPALARQAIMQQSSMGQNMAAQIAAMRAQEKQQAQMNYMNALQGNVQNYGNQWNAGNQMYNDARTGWGALNTSAQQSQSQVVNGFNQNPDVRAR